MKKKIEGYLAMSAGQAPLKKWNIGASIITYIILGGSLLSLRILSRTAKTLFLITKASTARCRVWGLGFGV